MSAAFLFGVKIANDFAAQEQQRTQARNRMFDRLYLNGLADTGRNLERTGHSMAMAASDGGQLAGQLVGGNVGRVLGGGAGMLLGQQIRHNAGNVGVTYGTRNPHQPIPLGFRDGKLTRQPEPGALEQGRTLENMRLRLGKPNAPPPSTTGRPANMPLQ